MHQSEARIGLVISHNNFMPANQMKACPPSALLILNARSIYNKCDQLNEMLSQIAPDLCLISETFERESKHIQSILNVPSYKNISYYRKNRAPGGGCAIIYNEKRFCVQDLSIPAHIQIENTWAIITPNQPAVGLDVKRITVASYYISPRSRHKQETIEHIIHTIHTLRAQFNNDISFLAGGDFNRVDISDILDSYGAMHQILSLPTRKSATLEVILTDLHTQYHPLPCRQRLKL